MVSAGLATLENANLQLSYDMSSAFLSFLVQIISSLKVWAWGINIPAGLIHVHFGCSNGAKIMKKSDIPALRGHPRWMHHEGT